ncbi:MAG: MFS transporter [Geminicoccaceae bacterium]|nr:MFS transporter [Geminicoccaceae bacterium]MDW8369272.1 MFS transporter [Geminicoccaceae bacterium]
MSLRQGPLGERDFLLFFAARLASGIALQILNVGIGWLVWELTADPFALGLVGLVTFLPAPLLVLPAGHLADRLDRRLVAAAGWSLAALAASGLLASVLAGAGVVWPVFLVALLVGSGRSLAMPAQAAIVPSLVPPHLLREAVALASMAFQGSIVAGPAIGGLLWLLGGSAVFGAALSGFLLAVTATLAIRPRPPAAGGEAASLARLLAGFGFVRAHRVILGAISLDMVAVLLGGATALLPIFAKDILEVGPVGLGALRAAPALGAVAMALVLARFPLERRVGRTMLAAVAGFGLAMAGFGLSTSFPLSLALLGAAGAADMVSVVVRQTLVQLETPDAMRGRVAAVNSLFIGASNELGEFESGVVAGLIGPVPATVVGGLGTVAAALLWIRLFPELARRDRLVSEPSPA